MGISHEYIIYDTQNVENNNEIDLLIYESKNTKVIANLSYKKKIEV